MEEIALGGAPAPVASVAPVLAVGWLTTGRDLSGKLLLSVGSDSWRRKRPLLDSEPSSGGESLVPLARSGSAIGAVRVGWLLVCESDAAWWLRDAAAVLASEAFEVVVGCAMLLLLAVVVVLLLFCITSGETP